MDSFRCLLITATLGLLTFSRMTDEQSKQLQDIQDGLVGKSQVEIVLAQFDEDVKWSLPYSKILTVYCKGYVDTKPEGCHPLPNVGREGHTYLHHIVKNYDNLADWTVFSQAEEPTLGYQGHRMGGGHMMPGVEFHDYVLRRGEKVQPDGGLFYFTSRVHLPTLKHVLRTSYMDVKTNLTTVPSRCGGEGGDIWGTPFDLGWFKNFLSKRCAVEVSDLESIVRKYWEKAVALPYPDQSFVHFSQGARFAVTRERILQRPKAHYEDLLAMLDKNRDPCVNYMNEWLWYYMIGKPEESPCQNENFDQGAIEESRKLSSYAYVSGECADGYTMCTDGCDSSVVTCENSTTCPCNTACEQECDGYDACYSVNDTCPCSPSQVTCYNYCDYDVTNYTCIDGNATCPCHDCQKTCDDVDGCMWIDDDCPVFCSVSDGTQECYNSTTDTTSCGSIFGCDCNDDEIKCYDLVNDSYTHCYPSSMGSCPVKTYTSSDCTTSEYFCEATNYDTSGIITSVSTSCVAAAANCSCGDNAATCDGSCLADAIGCSSVTTCADTERLCYFTNYDTSGSELSTGSECVDSADDCGCGGNASQCTYSYGGTYCESDSVGCLAECDVTTKKWCYTQNYDSDYLVDNVSQSCVTIGTTCPCGTNTQNCTYESGWRCTAGDSSVCPAVCSWDTEELCYVKNYLTNGSSAATTNECATTGECPCGANAEECTVSGASWCQPTTNPKTGTAQTCPVECTADEEECYVPSFWSSGTTYQKYCYETGSDCPCSSGASAKYCEYYGGCIKNTVTCPEVCTSTYQCPQYNNYYANGTVLNTKWPVTSCVSSYSECACGSNAKRCSSTDAYCIASTEPCPADCADTEKECLVIDYNTNGAVVAKSKECVDDTETCPCGANGYLCTSGLCVSETQKDTICPCSGATSQMCHVANFKTDGSLDSFSTVCVSPSDDCPCGTNTNMCTDSSGTISCNALTWSCPTPCTTAEISSGMYTCVQYNLDGNGDLVDKDVSCVADEDSCSPGRNMKKCDSGAVISVFYKCKDLYSGVAALATGTTQTAKLLMTLNNPAPTSANAALVAMNANLQTGSSHSTTMTVFSSSARRLRRRLADTSGGGVYEVTNTGSTSATPASITSTAASSLSSGDEDLTEATSSVGTVDTSAGFSTTTEVSKDDTATTSTTTTDMTSTTAMVNNTTMAMTTTVTTTTFVYTVLFEDAASSIWQMGVCVQLFVLVLVTNCA